MGRGVDNKGVPCVPSPGYSRSGLASQRTPCAPTSVELGPAPPGPGTPLSLLYSYKSINMWRPGLASPLSRSFLPSLAAPSLCPQRCACPSVGIPVTPPPCLATRAPSASRLRAVPLSSEPPAKSQNRMGIQ